MRFLVSTCAASLMALACSGSNPSNASSSGGGTSASSGGNASAASGGNSSGNASNSGGQPASGGTLNPTGGNAPGGTSALAGGAGGSAPAGGGPAIGGNKATGGAAISSGGTQAAGGVTSIGGSAPSGGTSSAGGNAGTGGSAPKGGTATFGGSSSTGGISATGGTGTAGAGVTGPWPPSATFSNPVIWQDLPDEEVIRVGDVFYFTASNMHYSPGAPILRSWDLVNWEFVGHAVPAMNFSSKYDLNGGQAYIKGDWASSLHYRASNQTFYWMGCIEFAKTYVYTASAVDGTWTQKAVINNCYYDCGMLVDYDNGADDTMYVAYGGGGNISVAQLSADYSSQVKAQQVYTTGGSMTLEGSHFFKYKNYYYITPTRPANGEFVLRATNVWGPYTIKTLIDANAGPISGAGTPHQGSFIQIQNGDWYYLAFQDAYPGGRVPVLAPVTWSADGWPSVTLVNNAWAASYPYPNVPRPPQTTKPLTGTDTFSGTKLAAEWEWNHNPDNTKWSLNGGLVLQTATVTNDLYSARNTLTHRILGPQSTATIQVDVSAMKDGDQTGLALFKNASAWIGIKKSGGTMKIAMVNGLTQDLSTFATSSTGTEAASAAFSGTTVWLRVTGDFRTGSNRQGKFSYSTDGTTFTSLGPAYTLSTAWQYYPGYRFAIFNHATSALGGSVTVKSFTLTAP